MIAVGPWREVERPADADTAHARGCWTMAKLGSEQHPLNVRALWDGDDILAVGGIIEMDKDGMAFVWWRPGLSSMAWRRILTPLRIGLTNAHERGIRRIFAVIAADHVQAVRLIKKLGFQFWNNETGFPRTDRPHLRYLRARPEIEEPALVAHQRRELEIACLAAWCPVLSPC